MNNLRDRLGYEEVEIDPKEQEKERKNKKQEKKDDKKDSKMLH